MGVTCGIVGLPNVGKSTLFNAITATSSAAAANYPFCTIEPNVGVVAVPDERLTALAAIVRPQQVLPTTIEFVDIAGLVAGAAKGEGLGNQFLGHIRETDAICHVVRCFMHDDIIHVAGKVDPIADIEVINTELALADYETVEKASQRVRKQSKSGNKETLAEQALLDRLKAALDQAVQLRTLTFSDNEKLMLKSLHLLTLKPVLYIANVDDSDTAHNPLLQRVQALAAQEQALVVPICAAIEAEIAQLPAADKADFLQDLGQQEPGLNRLIQAAYSLLGLQTYFTAGVKEVRAWTIKQGSTAPQAAGVIHSDFEHGFIRAEVIGYDDFIHYRGEQGAKEAGKFRLEGKEYIVRDGDVMHFRFNV